MGFRLLVFLVLIGTFTVSVVFGHSVNDKIDGYHWKDYACEHKMHDDYDIHHNHTTLSDADGNPIIGDAIGIWHWHKHAKKDNGDLLESYKDKHEGELSISHSADAWTSMGCSDEENDDRETSDDSGNNPSILPAEVEVVTPEMPISNPNVQPEVNPSPVTPSTTIPTTYTIPTTPTDNTSVIPIPLPADKVVVPEDTTVIDKPAEEIVEEATPVELVYYEYNWYQGFNLVSFPVLKEGIETIADLYAEYELLFQSFQLISREPLKYTGDAIYVNIDGCWYPYSGEEDNIIGDIEITPYLGVAMLMDWSALVGMRGQRLVGDGVFELHAGTNVVGITEMPVGIEKPSDFLLIDGVELVVSRGITDNGFERHWYLIGREGDPGDHIPVALGQAYIIISTSESMIEFGGVMAAPAAPPAQRSDTLETSWGAMKR